MGGRWGCVGGVQLGAGIASLLSGILAFFPVGAYKPWYICWGARIAAPVWNGALTTVAGTFVLMASRDQQRRSMWELSYIFSILCVLASPVQCAIAAMSVLLGPYCSFSLSGAVGTAYLAYAVRFPHQYLAFPGLCLEPKHYEWYHLALQSVDLLTSVASFLLSLSVVIPLTERVLRFGHVHGPIRR